MASTFLPISKDDLRSRGLRELDVIIVTGDAYVDHPAYGAAVIGRVLEAEGFTVGIIAQPDWHGTKDFMRLGRPRLFFGITSGNVDSMVANYTAAKRRRKLDDYSPGGKAGLRPDRAVTVYANRLREAYPGVPLVLGGIEASMRRLAHYDYWDNKVRRSVLVDSRGDILVYGMGETQMIEIARRLAKGEQAGDLDTIRGTAVIRRDTGKLKNPLMLPSFEEAAADTTKFNEAFRLIYNEQNPLTARPLVQKHGERYVVCFAPPLPLPPQQLDRIYELQYQRRWHPVYDREKVPGFETVRFSLTTHRGCTGQCSFCSLYFHQGRMIQSRSPQSIVREARRLTRLPEFKGTITDMGGPTANLYGAACKKWPVEGYCSARSCLVPKPCKNLELNPEKSLALYRTVRELPGVNHAFIGSGIRFDLVTGPAAGPWLEEVCRHHISGRMKVAPEHTVAHVLQLMGKPPVTVYEEFLKQFTKANKKLPQKCYLVNYFICGHPGTTLRDAFDFAQYLISRGMQPEQVQDFTPLPMTLSGCMYYTGSHPITGEQVSVPRSERERRMQRALVQYRNPANSDLIREALRELGTEHLGAKFFRKGIYEKTRGGRR
jgi:uncharacterized radical SAM protein YgiQ